MNFIKLFVYTVLMHGCFCPGVFALNNPGIANGTVFPGRNTIDTNYIKAPQPLKAADVSSLTMATSSASLTRNTTSGDAFLGQPVWSCDTSANSGYCEFKTNTILAPHDAGGNCAGVVWIKGDASLYSLQIHDGTNTITQAIGQNFTNYQMAIPVYGTCTATRTVRVTQTTAGTSPAINIGWVGYGPAPISQGTAPNRFTVSVSAADVESNPTPNGINWANCIDGGVGVKSCTFSNLSLSSIPNMGCSVTNDNRGTCSISGKSTTAFTVNTLNEGNPGTFTDFATDIWMEKTGADYVQNTITAQNFDYTGRVCTVSGSWVANTSYTCKESRRGKFAIYDITVATSGAPTATNLTINLPSGRTIDPLNAEIVLHSGTALDPGNNRYPVLVLYNNTTSVNIAALNAAGTYALTQSVSSTVPFTFAAGKSVNVVFQVPIVEFGETQNAPQLVGSVTSNSPSSLRIGAFLVSTTGVYTQLMGDPMLSGNCTVSGGSSNSYSCPFNFTASGGGACTGNSTAGGVKVVENVTVNTTSLTYTGADHAGTGQPVAMMWICLIPR